MMREPHAVLKCRQDRADVYPPGFQWLALIIVDGCQRIVMQWQRIRGNRGRNQCFLALVR